MVVARIICELLPGRTLKDAKKVESLIIFKNFCIANTLKIVFDGKVPVMASLMVKIALSQLTAAALMELYPLMVQTSKIAELSIPKTALCPILDVVQMELRQVSPVNHSDGKRFLSIFHRLIRYG